MRENIIIERSFVYDKEIMREIEDTYYDEEIGVWIDKIENIPLVFSERVSSLQTKKEDIETGEDKKGE